MSKDEIIKQLRDMAKHPTVTLPRDCEALRAAADLLSQSEQRCYCGDIYNLGVIHRDDGPCHYPEHTSEYKRGYADAMNWKVQNHLEHLPAAQPEQEPVAWMYPDALCDKACLYLCTKGFTQFPECATPPQHSAIARTWVGLTVEDKMAFLAQDFGGNRLDAMDWAEERLKEKNA